MATTRFSALPPSPPRRLRVGYLLPGFSAHDDDWAIPVQQELVATLQGKADVRVIPLRYPHTNTPYTLDGVPVYPLGGAQGRGWGRLKLWARALRLLRRLHRETPFDVLHATWADETGLLAVWAGRLLGIPSVVSIVGGELVAFHDIEYGLQRSAFSRWVVRQALRATALLPASEYQRRLLPPYYQARAQTVPLGVNSIRFTSSEHPPRARHLLHVGSLVPVKDQAMLLRTVARLPDVTLDIIGQGVEKSRLQAFAKDLDIAERVRFLGAVPYPELPSHYHKAALHVITSRHEGEALVTLEAAACGVPTVGTAVGLLADDPALGTAVPVGDDAGLAAAIRQLLDNEPRRAALGEAARARVIAAYTLQHTVKALMQIYKDL